MTTLPPDAMAGAVVALILLGLAVMAGELQARAWAGLFTFIGGAIAGAALIRWIGIFW